MKSSNYTQINEAKELLTKVWEDKEENFNLLDKDMIRKLNIWYLKALCNKTHAIPVGDFIKMLEKELKHVNGF
jgi:DnaJ-class molecular chaperone